MKLYIYGGAAIACIVINLINGLLIGAVSDRWNCK